MRTTDPANQAAQAAAGSGIPRMEAVDLLRGLVMILMALDHVRHFWNPTPHDPLDLADRKSVV